MKTEHKNVRSIRTAVVIILGNALYALTVKVFLLPGNLMVGGTTGIGLLIHRFTGMSLSGFVLLFNLVMLAARISSSGKEICPYHGYQFPGLSCLAGSV